jgi:excinuclease ABC subunit A
VSAELVIGDPIISILEGVILPWGEPSGHLRRSIIPGLADYFDFDPNTPWGSCQRPRQRHSERHGREEGAFPYRAGGAKGHYDEPWEGVLDNVKRRYDETTSETIREQLEEYMSTLPCQVCKGTRLKPESLAVTVAGKSIGK